MLRKIGVFLLLPVFVVIVVLINLGSEPISADHKPVIPAKKEKVKTSNVLPRVPAVDAELIFGVEPQYREDVAIMIDRMRSTIPLCNTHMDEGLVTCMDRGEATADPEFSAYCGKNRDLVRYFFRWTDIVNKLPAYRRTVIPHSEAVDKCRNKILANVKYPETAKFKNISYIDNQDGTANVAITLVASNAFGVPISHEARCVFGGGALVKYEFF